MENTFEHAVSADGSFASESGHVTRPAADASWRAREILRLLAVIESLRQDVAAGEAARADLRKINEEYSARVGHIRLLEEAERARSIELLDIRDEAAKRACECDDLRDELERSRHDAADGIAALLEERSLRATMEARAAALSTEIEAANARGAALDTALANAEGDHGAAKAVMVAEAAALQAKLDQAAEQLRDAQAVAGALAETNASLAAKAAALEAENERCQRWRHELCASTWWRFASLFGAPTRP